jgi:hypothetical protein
MVQYQLTATLPNVDSMTIWTKNGDFYWPDPTKVYLWDGESFQQNEEASIADLPDHFHWHEEYVENQPDLFTLVV